MKLAPLPKFAAVIHITSDEQAIAQTRVAFDNGARGIFLIDHKRRYTKVLITYDKVRQLFPKAWIGVNFLDLSPERAIQAVPAGADALWTDFQGLDEQEIINNSIRSMNTSANMGWDHFAGTAFKYQRSSVLPHIEAVKNDELFDVVCTSGDATGHAASIEKIISMREAIPCGSLALASGVTPDNVGEYSPYVDCLMVATGISSSFDTLDPVLVARLASRL